MTGTKLTVTRLDQMLYAWLAEADDRKFARAFEKYHAEAFMGLVKHLSRRSSSVELDFEQIAADALLKFFSKVGRERRAAANSIAGALLRIEGFYFSAFHVRQLGRWATDVGSFRETALSFRVDEQAPADVPWKAEIQSLTNRIPPLRRQGCHLLEPVSAAAAVGAPAEAASGDVITDEESIYVVYREFARWLKDAGEDSKTARSIEQRHSGTLRFVDGTLTIIDSLPLLRVPTNGYLFDIAQSLYLDECKSRGRQKRGGTGYSARADASNPVLQVPLDDEAPQDAVDGGGSALTLSLDGEVPDPSIDTEADVVGEEFCEMFYAYLRRPVDAAEEAFRIASVSGAAKAERKRLDSVAGKIERMITILSMRIEGQTQEAIAETLDISRNQVKYVVELVQASYEQFAAASMRKRTPPTALDANAVVR